MNPTHICFTLSVAAAIATMAHAEVQPAGDRPAYRAEDFVDSIGISAGLFDTRTRYDISRFTDLGVRHYRTVLRYDLTPDDHPARIEDLWRRTGARAMFLLDPRKSRTVKCSWPKVDTDGDFSALLEDLRRYNPSSIAEIESPNELNNKFGQDLNLKYKGRTDEQAGVLYQNDLYAALKSDPLTARIPIVMFTAIFTDYTLAGDCDAFDFLNTHPYQGDQVPSSSLLMNMTRTYNILPEGAIIGRFVPTECGYNVELDKANGMGYVGSLAAQAYNEPMLLAEYFRHGIPRTYLFSLPNVDGYGLLESDDSTRRPAWYALQSLIHLLQDATWDTRSLVWKGGREFSPRALRFVVEDAPDTVRTLTLQKENGDWYLLVWNELRNRRNGTDMSTPETSVTLRFASGTAVRCTGLWRQGILPADVYATSDGPKAGAFTPVAESELPRVQDGALALSVPSRLLVVRLTPEAPSTDPAVSVPVPTLAVRHATPASVDVALSLASEDSFASVVLFRNDMHVATFPRESFEEQDGRLVARYRDASAWIRPGLGYRFDAIAVLADGTQGKAAHCVATTPNLRPDLSVVEFGPVLPEGCSAPAPGDLVSFAGTVRNRGKGPTPNPTEGDVGMYNSSIALTFSVDGTVIGWGGDNGNTPMAPGDARRIESTGGGAANGRWRAESGTHVVKAVADDINRISDETDKFNNIASRTVTVGEFSGLLSMESCVAAGRVNLSQEGVLDWVCFDQWGDTSAQSRKKGANLIGVPVQDGHGYVNVNPGCAIGFTWGDDSTTGPCGRSHAGLWGNCVGNGYLLDVPAGIEERVLTVYVGVTNGGRGEFAAELTDGSAPPFTDTTWNANRAGDWSAVPGETAVAYTIRYRASRDGERLRVRWRLSGEANPQLFAAQIRLQGAALR